MPLKIMVKPNESTRIGRASVKVVSDNTSTLIIDGEVPVLRAEYTIDFHQVCTVTQKLHYVLQEMYLSEDTEPYLTEYFSLTTQLLNQDSEAGDWVRRTNNLLIDGQLYEAIKSAVYRTNVEAVAMKAKSFIQTGM